MDISRTELVYHTKLFIDLAENGQINLLKTLLPTLKCDTSDPSAIVAAAKKGHDSVIRFLIEFTNVNIINDVTGDLDNVLSLMMIHGDLDLLLFALSHRKHIIGKNLIPALKVAIRRRKVEIVEHITRHFPEDCTSEYILYSLLDTTKKDSVVIDSASEKILVALCNAYNEHEFGMGMGSHVVQMGIGILQTKNTQMINIFMSSAFMKRWHFATFQMLISNYDTEMYALSMLKHDMPKKVDLGPHLLASVLHQNRPCVEAVMTANRFKNVLVVAEAFGQARQKRDLKIASIISKSRAYQKAISTEVDSSTRHGLSDASSTSSVVPCDTASAEQQDSKSSSLKCSVCFSNALEMMAMPCDHMCSCVDCSKKMSFCPVCRTKVQTWKKVFVNSSE